MTLPTLLRIRFVEDGNSLEGIDTVINIMSIASNHLRTRPRHRLTDIATPIAAVPCLYLAVLGVPTPSTSSVITNIGVTCKLTRHLNTFKQSRFQDCNLIVLRFLGTVANFLCFLIHSLLAPFSTSRSKNFLTSPVLGGFNPRRNRSACLASLVYYITSISVIDLVLLFPVGKLRGGWGGKGG